MLDDEQGLAERARRGDRYAFVEIYDRYQPRVYTYILYRVCDPALAEELTADVFVQLVDKANVFIFQGKPIVAWLYTIAHNLIIDNRRHQNHFIWLPLNESFMENESDQPGKVVEHRMTQASLTSALNTLTEDQRQVVLLKFISDLSNAEVAKVMGKNEGSVKSLQHRALAALRNSLSKEQTHET